MTDLTYRHDDIIRGLAQLDLRSNVAFGLSCAERLLPNYRAFARENAWGDPDTLRQALDQAWTWLRGERPASSVLEESRAACETQAPDTDDFDSVLVSCALDAANVSSLVLDLVLTEDKAKAHEIASLAVDTVDMYVQEVAEILPSDPEREERIRLHPLMQAEIARQVADIVLLGATWSYRDLYKRWALPGASNIGLR